MTQRRGAAVVGGALVMLLFAVVSTSGPVTYVERWPDIQLDFIGADGPLFDVGQTELEETDPDDVFKIWGIEIPDILATILELVAIAGAVWIAYQLWTRRPRLRWRRPKRPDEFEVLDDIAQLLAEDRSAQRAVLAVGAPRNAIVECWMRLEAVTRAAGYEHDPSDTSAESTAKLLRSFTVDEYAVHALAALYREARFSSHEMTEEQRSEAVRSLDAIHDGLRAQLVA